MALSTSNHIGVTTSNLFKPARQNPIIKQYRKESLSLPVYRSRCKMAPTDKKSPLKSKNRAKKRVSTVFQAPKWSESLSPRIYLQMGRCPSLPLGTKICSKLSRFFVLTGFLAYISHNSAILFNTFTSWWDDLIAVLVLAIILPLSRERINNKGLTISK